MCVSSVYAWGKLSFRSNLFLRLGKSFVYAQGKWLLCSVRHSVTTQGVLLCGTMWSITYLIRLCAHMKGKFTETSRKEFCLSLWEAAECDILPRIQPEVARRIPECKIARRRISQIQHCMEIQRCTEKNPLNTTLHGESPELRSGMQCCMENPRKAFRNADTGFFFRIRPTLSGKGVCPDGQSRQP